MPAGRAVRAPFPWARVFGALGRHYASTGWRVPVLRERGVDPFRVLVSTLLSQRTRDEVTERATGRLLKMYPTSRELSRAPEGEIEETIREVGLSGAKAESLKTLAAKIEREFEGRVPSTEDALLSLPGVGPKTAHAVIVFGYQQDGLPIDTHIHRVVNRLGVVRTQTAAQTAHELKRALPRRYWNLINPTFVQHGMNLCSPRAPKCSVCPIDAWCLKVGVEKRGNPRVKSEAGS